MAGAIAGTAILKTGGKHQNLNTVTLTINNECNLHCDHCYLQYNSDNKVISQETINAVLQNDFKHLAIVGKEPLVNETSLRLLNSIVEKCKKTGKSVSLVTNGINLDLLPYEIMSFIDYVDVSFDGGFDYYEKYRKGDFSRIIKGIELCIEKGLKEVNALHTICDKTIDNISDCIRINKVIPFKTILFTPYIITRNHGVNSVSSVPLVHLIETMNNNPDFIDNDNSFLMIDNYHIEQEGLCVSDINTIISKLPQKEKYILYEEDPIHYGIIRVTYDGYILSPRQSLNTQNYREALNIAQLSNLNKMFKRYLSDD